uniref:TIR domain-containing protein n=1 Tax=Neogobius melanostomus TaxID=47308 RepID=A0A8C6UA40_9GOBI
QPITALAFCSTGRGVTLCGRCTSEAGAAVANSLIEVPTDIPPSVKSIDLSKNNFNKIQVANFTHFPNLTSLNLTLNSISLIGKRSFSKLVSLQQLTLTNNNLVVLQDDVFDGLSKLTELRIDFNHIQMVASNAFRSLSSLLVLDLSNNKLGTVALVHLAIQHTPQSQDLTNVSTEITCLDVSRNPLVRFEVTADVFPKLTNLNIGNPTVKTNLTWAVQNHSLLRHVTTLDISEVQLASIDQWRKFFTSFHASVTFLKLNSMRQMPALLINMSCSFLKLSTLQIRNNALSSIGSNLFQMCQNVTDVDLKGNNIIENSPFAFLHSLHALSLSRNRLRCVPPAARNLLKRLKELYLQNNRIAVLNKGNFYNLLKLERLDLQENQIFDLGKAFRKPNLPNLKSLNLTHNKLTTVNRYAFNGLQSLTNMSLAHNQIQDLQSGCFFNVRNLIFLQLQSNELNPRTLLNGAFKDVVKLKTLHLEDNHLKYSRPHLKVPLFMNLSRLETLIFDRQNVEGEGHIPSNFLQGLISLMTFSCQNLHLVNFSDNVFMHTPRLSTLDISNNDFHKLSPNLFAPIPNLTQLRIHNSNLPSLDFLIRSNLTKLKVLNAQRNLLSVISEDVIRSVPSLKVLDLKQNSFSCDCDNSWFVRWTENNSLTQVLDAHSFKCNYPSECRNTRLLDLNVQSCLVDISFICFISSTCVNIVILVASFTFHFSRFQLTYAYYIFLAWLYDSRNRQKRAACRYDAFVSYNGHDEAWVYRELVPHLEQDQGWRLCLHHRDFLPEVLTNFPAHGMHSLRNHQVARSV